MELIEDIIMVPVLLLIWHTKHGATVQIPGPAAILFQKVSFGASRRNYAPELETLALTLNEALVLCHLCCSIYYTTTGLKLYYKVTNYG